MKYSQIDKEEAFELEILEQFEGDDLPTVKFESIWQQRITIPSKDFSTSSFKSPNSLKDEKISLKSTSGIRIEVKERVMKTKCIQPNFFAEFSQKKLTRGELANFVRMNLLGCVLSTQKSTN